MPGRFGSTTKGLWVLPKSPPLPKARGQRDKLQAAHNRAQRMQGSLQGWCLPLCVGSHLPKAKPWYSQRREEEKTLKHL